MIGWDDDDDCCKIADTVWEFAVDWKTGTENIQNIKKESYKIFWLPARILKWNPFPEACPSETNLMKRVSPIEYKVMFLWIPVKLKYIWFGTLYIP